MANLPNFVRVNVKVEGSVDDSFTRCAEAIDTLGVILKPLSKESIVQKYRNVNAIVKDLTSLVRKLRRAERVSAVAALDLNTARREEDKLRDEINTLRAEFEVTIDAAAQRVK